MADGSIRVPTKIDLTGLKKGLAEMRNELKKAEQEYNKLNAQYEKGMAEYQKIINKGGKEGALAQKQQAKYMEMMLGNISAAEKKVEAYKKNLAEAASYYDRFAGATDASKQLDKAMADDKFVSSIKTQERYNSLLEQTKADMARMEAHAARISAETGNSAKDILRQNDAYQDAADKARLLQTRSKDISKNIKNAKKETKGLGDATKHGIAGFGAMQLRMMGLMFAMRAISAATQEYMSVNSQLEAQMNTLKALWGQVLGPVIEWVINLLIKAISAVNAFVYALTGINFVAKANAAALKKQTEASKQGPAAFDEQNKLSGEDPSKKAATLPDGTTMDLSFFDPLLAAVEKFKNDIAPLVGTIGDLFKWLWYEVLLPFADWAANGVLPAFLNILGGAFLVLNDALLFLQPTAQWLWENVLEPIRDWSWGVFVDGLNAIGDWIHKHHETLGKVVGIVGAIVAVCWLVPTVLTAISGAFTILFSPITLIVAAIVGLVALFVTLYDECEGFRKGMDQVWEGLKGIFGGAIEWIKALFQGDWAGMDAAWEKIKESGRSLWEGLVEGLSAGWEWCKEKVVAIWNKIVEKFKEIFGIHSPSTLFAQFGGFMMDGLVNGIKNAISKVTQACKDIWSAIKNVFASVGTWFKDTFKNAWQKVKEVFSSGGKIFEGIKDGIASTFKSIVNTLISGINKVIATPFNKINDMLNTIRSVEILGFTPFKNLWSYNPLSVPQIPKLALGGIVNRPGRGVPAIIGEAGAEAVLPLENNTEWMDILAEKIGGNVTIPIYLDGKKIYTYMVDIGKRRAFAANGG